jgi:ADP-dependent NAD(P)H-hydrate dehydratase
MTGSAALTPAILRRHPIPGPEEQGDKEERGRVLVVAGSPEVPGAALLAATAALRVGAGKVQLAVPSAIAVPLAVAMPEARVFAMKETAAGGIDSGQATRLVAHARDCRAILAGPGMMDHEAAATLIAALLREAGQTPIVLDAAALACLSRDGIDQGGAALRQQEERVVITPHPGEMARLLDMDVADITADPLAGARQAANRFGVVAVLKSARTHIVGRQVGGPQGEAFHLDEGDIGLATAGSGDVLAGIIAGLLARGACPFSAALWGVHLHREAGARLARSIGPLGYLARELLPEIPRVLNNPFADEGRIGTFGAGDR